MVVAEQWAEQRVLMRAYAESGDQTRPTIVLYGVELAIGPAGIDPHGPWGIHVHPQVDGRAQEIAEALVLAARRLAGSKGNPARLADESSDFERKRTDNWAPGAPRSEPASDSRNYFEPMVAASQSNVAYASQYDQPAMVAAQSATFIPQSVSPAYGAAVPVTSATPANAQQRLTPLPMPESGPSAEPAPSRRRRGWTSPIPNQRTALGYESGAGAQSAVIRLGLRPGAAAQLGRIVDRTVPAEFAITPAERDVLNMLAESDVLTARAIRNLIGVEDAVAWMEALIAKLASHGLDIVAPGPAHGGEPTYRLQR